MWRLIALAAVLIVHSGHALAQDGSEVLVERTPEGAVAFLDEFLRESRVRGRFLVLYPNLYGGSDRRRFQGWRVVQEGETYTFNMTPTVVRFAGVRMAERCITHFVLTDFHYSGTTGTSVDPYDQLVSTPAQTAEYRLDWSDVSFLHAPKIRDDSAISPGYHVSAWLTTQSVPPSFILPTIEDANRVQFAMEFLRAACVPKSRTGF